MTTTGKIHDTTHPLTCCDRCKTAELARRAKRTPTVKYGKTPSGEVIVRHGNRLIATLHKDSLFGWVADGPIVAGGIGYVDPGTRSTQREALDSVVFAYVAAWRRGDEDTVTSPIEAS